MSRSKVACLRQSSLLQTNSRLDQFSDIESRSYVIRMVNSLAPQPNLSPHCIHSFWVWLNIRRTAAAGQDGSHLRQVIEIFRLWDVSTAINSSVFLRGGCISSARRSTKLCLFVAYR